MIMKIAVLGGTGKEGSGLAMRWALNGYHVIVGSRSDEKAKNRAAEMNAELGGDYLTGLQNAEAAAAAEIVVLTVPYSAQKATLESIKAHVQGKIFVDVTVPLQPPNIREVHVPESHAASLFTQEFLGDGVRVVAAFQNISAEELRNPDHHVDSDVLIAGDDDEAKQHVIKLAEAAGMRGVDAGPLVNAVALEALTPVLLYINKAHGIKGSGIRITGI